MPLPPPEVIRQRAAEILEGPDYQLQPLGENGATLQDLLLRILEWLYTPFQILFDLLNNLSPVLAWLVTGGLLLVLAMLIAHMVRTFHEALKRLPERQSYQSGGDPSELDPEVLERNAEQEATAGNFIGAIRLLLRAVLLRLAEGDGIRFSPGLTNREYLRRYQKTKLFQPLLVLVDTVDAKWYGTTLCEMEDYQHCRHAHRQMVQQIQERVG